MQSDRPRSPRHPPRPPRPHGRLRGGLRYAPVLALLLGCTTATPSLHSAGEPLPVGTSGPLKAHLHSGDLAVFQSWAEDIENRQLIGEGFRYGPDRMPVAETTRLRIPVDSIALLELVRSEEDLGKGLGITLLAAYTVFTGAATAVCLADPKSCFGSCPTFYLDEGDGSERLVAEGFSSSVARALEATDLDDIGWSVTGGPFTLRMRNEALETHAVRSVRLRAVAEPAGLRAFATPAGRFLLAGDLREPGRCTGPEGDCTVAVRSLDGDERRSLTDPEDLAAREFVELEFPAVLGGRSGLVVGARHSFVTTFLFYQMLAYLGRDGGTFLASVERGPEVEAARIREVMSMLGKMEVSALDESGAWRPVATFEEAGPLAMDLHMLELPTLPEDAPVRIRLEMARGFWRLGYVALARIEGEVESRLLAPIAVERVGPDPGALQEGDPADPLAALSHPDRYLVTEPGDHYRFHFEVPVHAEPGGTHRLFLESTGYYYEWMRSEWLEEESPIWAAMMLLDPASIFRRLAPAFKEREAGMEEAFWQSRFRR